MNTFPEDPKAPVNPKLEQLIYERHDFSMSYNIYHPDDYCIGAIVDDPAGFMFRSTDPNNSCDLEARVLREIADKLDQLNQPRREEIRRRVR